MLSGINIPDADVLNAFLNLKTSKSMEPNGIPPIVLQKCATALYQSFCHLFKLNVQSSCLPRDWKDYHLVILL